MPKGGGTAALNCAVYGETDVKPSEGYKVIACLLKMGCQLLGHAMTVHAHATWPSAAGAFPGCCLCCHTCCWCIAMYLHETDQ